MHTKVLTITANPALDRTLILSHLVLGSLNIVDSSQQQPAGKGINVARALHVLDVPVKASGFLGGVVGQTIKSLLPSELPTDFFQVQGCSRVNIKLLTQEGTTELNEVGPEISAEEKDRFFKAVPKMVESCDYLVLSGSLPKGCGEDFYYRLIRLAKSHQPHIRVVLDSSGAQFERGLKAQPFLVKPNLPELVELLGNPISKMGEAVEGCRELLKRGAQTVVLSLGGNGMVAVTEKESFRVKVPRIKVANTVGCGDSLVAGLIAGLLKTGELSEAILWGAAAGSAAALSSGIGLERMADFVQLKDQLTVSSVDYQEPIQ